MQLLPKPVWQRVGNHWEAEITGYPNFHDAHLTDDVIPLPMTWHQECHMSVGASTVHQLAVPLREPCPAQRIANERMASAAEATARATAAAVAGQSAAGSAAEHALLELQGRMAQALQEVEGDRWVSLS